MVFWGRGGLLGDAGERERGLEGFGGLRGFFCKGFIRWRERGNRQEAKSAKLGGKMKGERGLGGFFWFLCRCSMFGKRGMKNSEICLFPRTAGRFSVGPCPSAPAFFLLCPALRGPERPRFAGAWPMRGRRIIRFHARRARRGRGRWMGCIIIF